MRDMIFDGYCIPGTERDSCLSIDDLLRQLDEAGIAKALIAPEDRELVLANATGNDRILSAAARYPDRLVPACGINPWYGAAAVDELERCVGRGVRMLVLAPALQGFIPTDELCDDLLNSAARLGVPVYIHTGPHSSGGPTQVVLVAEKHSATRFVVGHSGSTDHAWDMSTILKNHRLQNLWFELSFVRPWVVPGYVELAGSSRFIWASSAPRNLPKFELEQLGRFLSPDRYPDIFGGNLCQLLGIGSRTS
jgi:predicted TIM-barrel fold metal-dependent hydrolase